MYFGCDLKSRGTITFFQLNLPRQQGTGTYDRESARAESQRQVLLLATMDMDDDKAVKPGRITYARASVKDSRRR